MGKILIFAGTSEGRMLIEEITEKLEVHCCVATEYGKELLPKERTGLSIFQGRLTLKEMMDLMESQKYDMVIDTTHPYAKIVTENIIKASEYTKTPYIRFLRESEDYEGDIEIVDTVEDAVEHLNETDKKALLTVGSKELAKFTKVKDFEKRLYVRVLPMADVVEQCIKLNFKGDKLICMQGPFSEKLNEALIDQTGAEIMVTKDTGKAGGFLEKVQAAIKKNLKIIVIKRPLDERGYSMDEIKNLLVKKYGKECILSYFEKNNNLINPQFDENRYKEVYNKVKFDDCSRKKWFPIFINIKKEKILVVGAGKIAKRRLRALREFDTDIKIISPLVDPIIERDAKANEWDIVRREFKEGDVENMTMALIATDDFNLNREIGNICREKGLKVNVASDKNECDYYFPGIITRKEITIGVTAQGKDHHRAKEITEFIDDMLPN